MLEVQILCCFGVSTICLHVVGLRPRTGRVRFNEPEWLGSGGVFQLLNPALRHKVWTLVKDATITDLIFSK